MRYLWMVVTAVLMVGCSADYMIRYGIAKDKYSFQPSESNEYDYLVKLKKNPDFDLDKAETRLQIVKQLLGESCQSPVIINEQLVDQGKALSGFHQGTYFLKVSCPK